MPNPNNAIKAVKLKLTSKYSNVSFASTNDGLRKSNLLLRKEFCTTEAEIEDHLKTELESKAGGDFNSPASFIYFIEFIRRDENSDCYFIIYDKIIPGELSFEGMNISSILERAFANIEPHTPRRDIYSDKYAIISSFSVPVTSETEMIDKLTDSVSEHANNAGFNLIPIRIYHAEGENYLLLIHVTLIH